MFLAQQFDYPKTETELREIQDKLYQHSKEVYDAGGRPAFKGLLEIMSAEATIVTAIHNIKSNRGSETPGVDSKTMRKDYLHRSHSWVIKDIQNAFKHFEPQKIRRVYIDKPGKSEKRPLGIPAIRDRIVQECIRIVLEPIFEAQFFAHSYGFRPMRDASMALERAKLLVHRTGYYWIVEGNISKCFDRIDHAILLKRLYYMGVKDRRALQIIKAMLKAGIMGECEVNEEGTPQGGLISPLLANVYPDIMDEWISSQWERKKTRTAYSRPETRLHALHKRSNLIPGYLVRYADDFVIISDTCAHAEGWKARLQAFLQSKMKLTLSQEKTLITDIRKKHIKFIGYVGFTALTFCKWERTPTKGQEETPYTEAGRQINFERTKKKRIQARFDELYSEKSARAINYGKWGKLNNFEFIMNRAYALNRDKLKCGVCGGWLISSTPWAHRINPNLPLDRVNRVNNLVSLHKECFMAVNNPTQDISQFDVKAQKKIIGYREKLVPSHTRNK